jgi:hypothetical protein
MAFGAYNQIEMVPVPRRLTDHRHERIDAHRKGRKVIDIYLVKSRLL